MLHTILDFVLHLDKHLDAFVQSYGNWTYVLLFAIIFCETGLVVMPFLPGDSLLFAVGTLAASGTLNGAWLALILIAAAVLGNVVNYGIGYVFGKNLLEKRHVIKPKHIEQTHEFYEKYGPKAVVIGRFLPVIRTMVPFVAGMGRMSWHRYFIFTLVGSVLWIGSLLGGGYFFGNIPVVRSHFSAVVLAIIIISMIPPGLELWKAWRKARQQS